MSRPGPLQHDNIMDVLSASLRLCVHFFFLSSLAITPLIAQVSVSGIFDAEFRKGGDGSSFERNEFLTSHPSITAQRLQLFLDADLGEDVTFTAKLQNNEIYPYSLKTIELQLAYVTINNIFGQDVNFSIGRILTPFGQFAKRQLSTDNPLIWSPLYFQYSVKVSSSLGYRPNLAPGDPYGGLSTMYRGGYYTGAELFGSLGEIPIAYDLAVTNAPISIFNSELNPAKTLSYQGRLSTYPWMWLEVGVSASYGPFMDEALGGFRQVVNDTVTWDLGRYKQTTIGLDVTVDWLYYRVTAEYIRNEWDSPFIVTTTYPYTSGIPWRTSLKLSNNEYLVDIRVDIPYVVGLYLAGRFDLLEFDTINDPLNPGTSIRWDNTVRRYGIGAGYKLTRRMTLKAEYEWMDLTVTPKPYLNRWGMQVSTAF